MEGVGSYSFSLEMNEKQRQLTHLLTDRVKPSVLAQNPPFLSSYANQALNEQRNDW